MTSPLAAGLLVLTIAAPAFGQDPQAAPPPQATQAATAPNAQLGSWWLVNARAIEPLPESWLVHTEGQVSFTRTTGNVEGHTIAGGALFAVRKGIVTDVLSVSPTVNKTSLGAGRGSVSVEVITVVDLFTVNIYKRTNLAAGLLYERDDPKFLKKRAAGFAGVSRHLIVRPKQTLQAFGGFGYEHEEATIPGFDASHSLFYISEAYNAQLTPKVYVRQALELWLDLASTGNARRNFNAAVDLQITRYLAVSPTFQIRYDGETTPQAEHTDTTVMVAIRFSR